MTTPHRLLRTWVAASLTCGGCGLTWEQPEYEPGQTFVCPRCLHAAQGRRESTPAPTWKCEYCGQFYSERTGAAHLYCQQEQDRKDAERAGAFDV